MERMINDKWKVWDSSPQALAKIIDADLIGSDKGVEEVPKNAKYPFMGMKIGESYLIDFRLMEANTKQNITSVISYYKKKTFKQFCVISHSDQFLLEVARIY